VEAAPGVLAGLLALVVHFLRDFTVGFLIDNQKQNLRGDANSRDSAQDAET
jgi:hypothetical protein